MRAELGVLWLALGLVACTGDKGGVLVGEGEGEGEGEGGEGEGEGGEGEGESGCSRFDGLESEGAAWDLPGFGEPSRDYDWDEWYKTSYDSYTDGLNWVLTDLTGDGAPDLVVTYIDEYVTGGDEAPDGLGRNTWMVYENKGDRFASDPVAWDLPGFGEPDRDYSWEEWYKTSYDSYTDGLNWALMDLTGDGAVDLVVTYIDEYVTGGDEAPDGLGRNTWMVYENQGDGFASDPVAWDLPGFGEPDRDYDWDEWYKTSSDYYTDGLNWALMDLTGDGAVDLVVTWTDEYVTGGDEASDGLGRNTWMVYENKGDGFASDPTEWDLPGFGQPDRDYSWDEWYKTSYDHYTDGLNWALTDLTGDGAVDLVVTWTDEYVTGGDEASDGLGRNTWMVYENQGDGFASAAAEWDLPGFGQPDRDYSWDEWYKTTSDYYTDGLNWALADLNGDGASDLVVTYTDEYVTGGDEAPERLGRDVWMLYPNEGDRFSGDMEEWSLPNFGAPTNDYSWDEWYKTTSDTYTDGLNWALTDLDGDGGPDVVVTYEDEYVREPTEEDGLGRNTWVVWRSECAD